MHKTLALTSIAAVLALSGTALAQAPAAKAPTTTTTTVKPGATTTTTTAAPATAAAPAAAAATTTTTTAAPPASAAPAASTTAQAAAPAAGTDAAASAGASATVMSGMSVKDNTGALIGEVKAVKGTVATIAMGTDTFNVDTDKLGVTNGVATINASQAEIKKMLPAKK
jgi:hypothetical protein